VPTALQTKAFVAGIYNVPLTGNPVVVTSSGQLGVQAVSSERFKTAIAPMGSNSAKLGQLRPVTFHLKTDPKGTLQYGLIAEEVAKVYPELVIRGEKGRIDGVRYDELAPMLLNEMQQQHTQMTEQIDAQAAAMRDLKQKVEELKAINQATQVALQKIQAKDELTAQR
jgi:Chaperone of endosialidase